MTTCFRRYQYGFDNLPSKLIFSRKKRKDYRCIQHVFLLLKGRQDLVFTQDGLILFHSTFLKNMPRVFSKFMKIFSNKSITKWTSWKNVKMQMFWVLLVFQLNFQQTPSILLVSKRFAINWAGNTFIFLPRNCVCSKFFHSIVFLFWGIWIPINDKVN